MGSDLLHGYEVSFCGGEKVLEMYSGDDYTPLPIYLISLNCTFYFNCTL